MKTKTLDRWYKKGRRTRARKELNEQSKVEVPVKITFSLDLSVLEDIMEKSNNYYFAFDKKIGKRVVHVLREGYLVSLVTGSKQKYKVQK